jgi:pyruvate,water dikinase
MGINLITLPPKISFMLPVIKMLSQIGTNDIPFLTNRHIGVSEKHSNLTFKGISIPKGFVITATAFDVFFKENKLQPSLDNILKQLKTKSFLSIAKTAKAATQLVLENELPHKLEIEIRNAHYKLCGEDTNLSVTIRSSAATRDLPACGSFTQQLESFVNIKGENALVQAVHKCFASLFTEKAIYDRQRKGINSTDVAVSIAVEKVETVKCSSSNLAFAVDPLKGFNKIMSFKSIL